MNVRRATEADTDTMRRLWDAFTVEATFTPYPGSPFEPALLTDHTALVAEEGDEIVGTLYVNTSSEHFGFVFGVYTVPESRGRGVATALMRAAARLLREQGREHLVLSVDTPNEGARAFYERLGFTDTARTLRVEVDALI